MIGTLRIARSKPRRNVAERFSMKQKPKNVPPMMTAMSHHHVTTKSEMAITISVGAGSAAPKLENTFLNDGITQTMMIHMTTMATVMTEIG